MKTLISMIFIPKTKIPFKIINVIKKLFFNYDEQTILQALKCFNFEKCNNIY